MSMTMILIQLQMWNVHFLMNHVQLKISKHFYLRLQHRIWSRWQEKQKSLQKIILEIQFISLPRYILQTTVRIIVFIADLTVIIISDAKN